MHFITEASWDKKKTVLLKLILHLYLPMVYCYENKKEKKYHQKKASENNVFYLGYLKKKKN